MRDVNRLSPEEFFGWQALVEGRYELVDGHITPHPDFVTPQGFVAPDNDHAAICGNIVALLQARVRLPCRVYVGAWTIVDRANANMPDVTVSCSEADRNAVAIAEARFIFEVSSPKTTRIDTGRKVGDYLAIATLEGYVFVDRSRRTVTMYRSNAGPQTFSEGSIAIGGDVTLDVAAIFA